MNFRDDMGQAMQQFRRQSMAWLGALQYAAYSEPPKTKRTRDDEGHVESEVRAGGAAAWHGKLRDSIESVLKDMEGSLMNAAMMERDPRHSNEETRTKFVARFEGKVSRLAEIVMQAQEDIDKGAVRPSRAIRETTARVKKALYAMVNVFAESGYELGESESGGLLALRIGDARRGHSV